MTIGENIRHYRKLNNLSAKALADKLNCSAQAILQYERNERKPSLEILTSICEVLSIPVEMLINTNFNGKFIDFAISIAKESSESDKMMYNLNQPISSMFKYYKKYNDTITDSLLNFIKHVDSSIDLEGLDDRLLDSLCEDVCDLLEFKLYKHFKNKG